MHLLSHGIYDERDLKVMHDVVATVCLDPGFPPGAGNRAELASYVMAMYRRGLVLPDKLEALCRAAVRKRFASRTGIEGYRFLLVEDDYFVAADAKERLASFGAEVLPVPSVSAALDVAEHAHDLDGALLDVNLAGEMVYPVAALLKMRQIPFVFVTGYEARVLPSSYRNAKVFAKPTDWAVAASHLAQQRPQLAAWTERKANGAFA